MNIGMNKIKVDGYNVPVYIPENCSKDTKVVVYYNGSGGPYPDRYPLENELKANGSDAIVVFAANGNYDAVNSVIGQVANQYNIDELHVTPVGFSMGSYFSTYETLNVIKNNPDAPPQMLVHLDGYNTSLPSIFKKNAQTLVDNNSVVLSIYGNKTSYKHLKDYKALAEAGVNVLFINYKDRKWRDHILVNKDFFTADNLNFLAGTGKLNEMYSISVYDKETGGLREINYNDINDLEKIYDYFGISTSFESKINKLLSLSDVSLQSLSANTDILQQPFNAIIGKIKSSSYLSSSQSDLSFTSTTKFPSQVPDVARMHFEATVELLYKLSNDMREFAKIGPLIDKIDRDMAKDATQLLEQQNSTVNVGATTLSMPISSDKVVYEEKDKVSNKQVVLDNGTPFSAGVVGGFSSFFGDLFKKNNKSNNTETLNSNANLLNSQVDNSVNEVVTKTEEQVVTISDDNQKGYSYSGGNYYSNSGANNEVISVEVNSLDEFPKYEEIYSDDNRIVYNYNDEYKIVVHRDGDNIIGIEHYYDFGTEENATSALDGLRTEYANVENTENIIQNGRYVKVVFNEGMYDNLSISDVRNKYSDLSEIVKI